MDKVTSDNQKEEEQQDQKLREYFNFKFKFNIEALQTNREELKKEIDEAFEYAKSNGFEDLLEEDLEEIESWK